MATLETLSKRTDENKIEMTVTVPASDVQGYIEAAYKEAGRVRIPGFRPGKAPRRVLENHYGGKDYFLAQATDELVKECFPLAIDHEGYVPLDKPAIAELDLVAEGAEFRFEMSFTVRPVYELSSYGPVQIELPSPEPSPEEIQQEVDIMLEYYIEFEDVTDRPVQQGDFVTLDMEVTNGGERVEQLSGPTVPYELGAGSMPLSFDEQLLGAQIDETREFDFGFSSDEEASLVDGDQASHAVATVKGIRAKVKPELTDAWVKEKIEFDSVEEFKNRIAEAIRAQRVPELESLKDRLVSEELAARLLGEPTDVLVTQTEQGIYRDFFASLQRSNQSFDAFLASTNTTPEAFREDIKRQAVEVTAQTLALDALALHLALEITNEEIRAEFESSGAEDPDALFLQWKENGRLSEVREGLLRMKAARHLNETAEIFEPGKKPVDPQAADLEAAAQAASKKPAAKKAKEGKTGEASEAGTEKAAEKPIEADAEKATAKAAGKSDKKASGKVVGKSTEKEPVDNQTATDETPEATKADSGK